MVKKTKKSRSAKTAATTTTTEPTVVKAKKSRPGNTTTASTFPRSHVGIRKMLDSTIWPGKRYAFPPTERKAHKPVMSYDISYLFDFGVIYEEVPTVGFVKSKKYGKTIPYYNSQEKAFIEFTESRATIVELVEKPVELVYNSEFTSVFVPDFLFFTSGGEGIFVMLMPYKYFAVQETQQKWYALMKYCADNGYGCLLMDMESGITMKFVLKVSTQIEEKNLKFSKMLDEMFTRKHTKWLAYKEYVSIIDELHVNDVELQAMVLMNQLIYVPKSPKNYMSLLKQRQDDVFNSQLIMKTMAFQCLFLS